MADNEHYAKLEDEYKSRRITLQSIIESCDEEEDSANLYPALNSLKSVKNRYSKHRLVAEGGEKRIEAAFDSIAQREVAFARPKDNKPAVFERFLREARLMAFLEHPNIMPVYDIGLVDEVPYFTMELIHGDNLAKNRGKESLARKELDELLVVLIRVCDAMAFAHNKGIVHLDIKPQNIQIGPFGEVLLCDWGLSKVSGKADDFELPEELDNSLTADLTVRGVLRGTPGYMSPSLAEGKQGEFQDDIYALGATLYYILCAQSPHFSKDVKETISKTVLHEVDPPSSLFPHFGIPQALEAVALKALDKERPYKSVVEFRNELTSYLRGYVTKAEDASLFTIFSLLYKRQKVLCNTIMAALVAIIILTVFFISSLQSEKVKEIAARLEAEEAKTEAESSLSKYKNELRYNRYLMDGIDRSLKKIISEVEEKNLPVDIEKILVKVGRGNLNREAYEAAAQMLETLTENSTGRVKDDAIHDLIFTKIFMHDFEGALTLLENLSEDESARAEIGQFKEICAQFKDLEKVNDVLPIKDFRKLVAIVQKHERTREWFFGHAFNYYLRKCYTDAEILDLYDVVLDLKVPQRKYGIQISKNYGKKVLFFTSPFDVKVVYMPQILDGLAIDVLDLRGTSLVSLGFVTKLNIKEVNICETRINDLRPLTNIPGLEKVIVGDLDKVKGLRILKKKGVQIQLVK